MTYRSEQMKSRIFATVSVVFAVLAVGSFIMWQIDEARQNEKEVERLHAECKYLGNRISVGFVYRDIHRWDCDGAIVERRKNP